MTMNQVFVEVSEFPPVVADPNQPPLQDQDYALLSVVGFTVEVVVVALVVVRDVMSCHVVVVVADWRKQPVVVNVVVVVVAVVNSDLDETVGYVLRICRRPVP